MLPLSSGLEVHWRSVFFWDIMQHRMVIPNQCFWTTYQNRTTTLCCNIPLQPRSHLHCRGSLKSRRHSLLPSVQTQYIPQKLLYPPTPKFIVQKNAFYPDADTPEILILWQLRKVVWKSSKNASVSVYVSTIVAFHNPLSPTLSAS